MAGLLDPFSPGPVNDPTAGVDPSTYTRVRQEWDSFLGNPQGRAALLSAGLALMQPPSFGDTPTSQIGRAIGAAGQSASANQAMDLKEREQESKADLRSAQAAAAEARAETAGARAGSSGARLELARERLESQQRQSLLGSRIRLSNMYQNYVKDIAKRNSDAKIYNPSATPEPVLSMQDWISQNPMLRQMGLVPSQSGGSVDDEGEDAVVPSTAPQTISGGAALEAPRDPAARTPNTVYKTPKGPLKWTGTGWVNP